MTIFYGPYKRIDGMKLKGHLRVVIRFKGQQRAVFGPYGPKGTFHLPGLYKFYLLIVFFKNNEKYRILVKSFPF